MLRNVGGYPAALAGGGARSNLLLAASISVASLLALGLVAVSLGVSDGANGSGKGGKASGKGKKVKGRKQRIFMRGLYNLGNTCFLNSTLQSLSSLEAFNEYVDSCAESIRDNANINGEKVSVDGAIILQLKDVLEQLKPQISKVAAYSPSTLISCLSKRGRWLLTRNEQDAQELFQLVSSILQTTRREVSASLFNSQFLTQNAPLENSIVSTASSSTVTCTASSAQPYNPLQGMAASRIACVKCGYTAAIRHFTFDNLSLSVPRKQAATIEECLSVYTVIDKLTDFKCRYCTVEATLARTKQDLAQATADLQLEAVQSSQKRIRKSKATIDQLTQQQESLENALATNPEAELEGIRMADPCPGVSTKQTMIARTPKILVLHLSRSIFLPSGDVVKNSAKVRVQPLLDISPFTTNGHINTNASKPISAPTCPSPLFDDSALVDARRNNCLYRLSAIVLHVGGHDSGHYSAYRRVPCASESEGVDSDSTKKGVSEKKETLADDGSRWFLLSDIRSVEVSLQTVLSSGDSYLLFYERL
ncbi:ubiquitin-specific protease ubp1 [Coemansia sp. IMI 203386]|nr:ubiquitin-specific protease ubp1 [Coemansia sp. IMI 203386]